MEEKKTMDQNRRDFLKKGMFAGMLAIFAAAGSKVTEAGSLFRNPTQQTIPATTLTDASTISWDLDKNQVSAVTLAGNRTLSNPTNMKNGGVYILIVKQDSTGSRTLSYGSAYKWPSAGSPTLSTTASAVDIITFVSDGSSMYGVYQGAFS